MKSENCKMKMQMVLKNPGLSVGQIALVREVVKKSTGFSSRDSGESRNPVFSKHLAIDGTPVFGVKQALILDFCQKRIQPQRMLQEALSALFQPPGRDSSAAQPISQKADISVR